MFWTFDNGNLTFKERTPDEGVEEKRLREENIKNRLSGGTAGLGSMFTSTNGGVQRTATPGLGETVATVDQRDLPKTVSTGRTREMSAQEQSLKDVLKGIEGTTQSSIIDRATGLSSRISGTQGLGSYAPTNQFTLANLNNLLKGTTTIDDIKKQEEARASGMASSYLESVLNPITEEQQLLQSVLGEQSDLLNNTGISNLQGLDIQGLSPKARQSFQARLSRLRDTGLQSDVLSAQDILNQAMGATSGTQSELDNLASMLQGQSQGYGINEIGGLGTQLAQDSSNIRNMLEKAGLIGDVESGTGRTYGSPYSPGSMSAIAPAPTFDAQDTQLIRGILGRYGASMNDYSSIDPNQNYMFKELLKLMGG